MERRVALLRAINVGGTGTLRMERLRAIAAELGWKDVATLGASGNLLYTAGKGTPAADARKLAAALEKELGKVPTVIVRSHAELVAIVKAKPFAKVDTKVPPKWWFVGLLAEPSKKALPEIAPESPLLYAKRLPLAVCWTMSEPHIRALDHPKRIEKALGIPMTVRNWNVVNQIVERLDA